MIAIIGFSRINSRLALKTIRTAIMIQITSIVILINEVLSGSYTALGDMNQDGVLDVLDVVNIVNYILGN